VILQLRPTHRIARLDGQRCRLWTGTTEEGLTVGAWIHRVDVDSKESVELNAFEESLLNVVDEAKAPRLRAVDRTDA
jgi:hypothetical protein